MSNREDTIEARDGGQFKTYRAAPARLPAAGILVVQEIFGVNAVVRAVADQQAADGWLAAAPDLFWRQQPGVELDSSKQADRDRAMALNQGLDQDCEATVDRLRADPECTGKVGVIGHCLGGRVAYLLAARSNVEAAVGYYGVGLQNLLDEASAIRRPLLLHIAQADHLCPPEAQQVIVDILRQRAPSAVVHVYPGVGHGFARKGGQNYDFAAAELADRRTRDFLAQHLSL